MITTEKLSKKYKDVLAVNEVSLHIEEGEIYGFLGLNGAGKTTSIRLLLGMVNPTSGIAYINGKKVHPNHTALWQEIGYLVEIPYAYQDLTVKENLELFRRLRFVEDKSAVNKIIDTLKLTPYTHRKARHLSTGNAQRLGLAKALIHNPSILILDEPANGLDPAGIFEIRALLSDLAVNYGKTIFLSSHILGEVSKFAHRIGIIHEGTLIQEINTHELELLCQKKLKINTKHNDKVRLLFTERGIPFKDTEEGLIEMTDEQFIRNPDELAVLLVNSGLPPSLLHKEYLSLVYLFRKYL